jgi:hypothetical protein
MRLKEILEDPEDNIQDLTVYIPVSLLSPKQLAMESIWVHSGYKDLVYRVDPERPEMKQQRHVHITRERHKAAKDSQVSWNIDGTRHDKKSFDKALGDNRHVRELASRVLELGDAIALEHLKTESTSVVGRVLLTSDGTEAMVIYDI